MFLKVLEINITLKGIRRNVRHHLSIAQQGKLRGFNMHSCINIL